MQPEQVGPRAGQKFVAVAGSLLLGLLITELGLRLIGVRFDASLYDRDSIRGWQLRPNAHGWWVSEGNAYVKINSDGMRDREHSTVKPPGTFRIAVLGDSFAAARQVPMEKYFCSVLERELARCPGFAGKKIETLNFGVDGYGTAQELLTLRYHVWKYSPDLVLLAFTTENDVYNNSHALNPVDADLAPYFVLDGNKLVQDDSFRRVHSWHLTFAHYFGDLTNRLRTLALVNSFIVRGIIMRRAKKAESRQIMKSVGAGLGAGWEECAIYAPPSQPALQEAWRVNFDEAGHCMEGSLMAAQICEERSGFFKKLPDGCK